MSPLPRSSSVNSEELFYFTTGAILLTPQPQDPIILTISKEAGERTVELGYVDASGSPYTFEQWLLDHQRYCSTFEGFGLLSQKATQTSGFFI